MQVKLIKIHGPDLIENLSYNEFYYCYMYNFKKNAINE